MSSLINKRSARGLELGSLMRKRWIIAALVGILFASGRAMAQGSGFGMGFKGGYVDISGGDLSAVQGGFGLPRTSYVTSVAAAGHLPRQAVRAQSTSCPPAPMTK